ncbi:YcgL domain-containing protein [Psychromonas sp. Urea-02u-13]|uniref:YcgL domain-containing protein n=1 Tax=Psychromonas sp. Urea-02u-13 TaxID=2058326 RepID=UPI000C33CFA4|nr:YcgL domain-containing protein [Psychromonas sp. Urea-02u-13]PKG40308.1 hypothetical protein CXF74_04375 [Psychromonas sp. Urea-02u-13]
MLCAVYKSIRKSQTYLFIAKRDNFEPVPDALLTQFGPPALVSMLNIKADSKLAMTDANTVIQSIEKDGFYLQLPPPPVDYLEEHKKWRKKQLGIFNETD